MSLSERDRRFAQARRVARLATTDAGGVPHVIPIVYAVDGDDFYFVVDDKPKRTRTGLKRLRNIEANARVALVIDDYSDDWQQLAYLLVQGSARIVGDAARYQRILELLRERYPQYRAMDLTIATHPMVRIAVEHVHFWSARG